MENDDLKRLREHCPEAARMYDGYVCRKKEREAIAAKMLEDIREIERLEREVKFQNAKLREARHILIREGLGDL